jgi:hypothetical protein
MGVLNMKKILLTLLLCLFLPALALADTVTYTRGGLINGVREYKFIADNTDTDGTINGSAVPSDPIYGFLVGAVLIPGTSFTDTDWNLELRDSTTPYWNWLGTSYTSNSTTKKVLCPLDANNAYFRLQGQRVYIYASGMAGSVNSDFTFYLYVREQ